MFSSVKILLTLPVILCILGDAVMITALPTISTTDMDTRDYSADKNTADSVQVTKEPDSEDILNGLAILKQPKGRLDRKAKLRRAREADTAPDGDTHISPAQRDLISCVSHKANNTIPAAHIKAHGTRPFARSTVESSKLVPGYQQRWQCCEYGTTPSHNSHAFVDGGMEFNQTDKSLVVPTCGYYHIFSQIYFNIEEDSVSNSASVYHLFKFKRNCSMWPENNPGTLVGRSVVTRDVRSTTTSTSDVVHLCAGGKIWVEIPDIHGGVPCCPMGDEQATFITAHLVAETTCHWPPSIEMDNFNEK